MVLSWAPHVKALPHAVANSFTQAMQKMDVDFVITNPEGYNLNPEITKNTPIFITKKKHLKMLILFTQKTGVLMMIMEKKRIQIPIG